MTNFKLTLFIVVSLVLATGNSTNSQEPGRGPGADAAVDAPANLAAEPSDEPVVGQLEYDGWGLVGSGGRHYVFGGLAVADYVRAGRHYIVTLQQEEPSLLPKPDDNYLYYRELGSGRRWAIGRHPQADETYLVFFQSQPEPTGTTGSPAAARPKWTLFHRARLTWPEREAAGGKPRVPQTTQRMKAHCLCVP